MNNALGLMFQHTAARRRLGWKMPKLTWQGKVSTHSRPKAAGPPKISAGYVARWFQHTAARRRLGAGFAVQQFRCAVSTHSRPKAAGGVKDKSVVAGKVSTHSRPKAAGKSSKSDVRRLCCFNTQPPEGGWQVWPWKSLPWTEFQHTAARRRLAESSVSIEAIHAVSTHSRPKAAGSSGSLLKQFLKVSTHSRPKAAGSCSQCLAKAAPKFQHTAARRRLAYFRADVPKPSRVSTHSRPKAAG